MTGTTHDPSASGNAAPAPAPSKAAVFLRRSASTVLLWTIILAAMFSGNRVVSDYVFLGLMLLLASAGLVEFYGLAAKRGLHCFKGCGLAGGGPRLSRPGACARPAP
jgi:hypothetical protein